MGICMSVTKKEPILVVLDAAPYQDCKLSYDFENPMYAIPESEGEYEIDPDYSEN